MAEPAALATLDNARDSNILERDIDDWPERMPDYTRLPTLYIGISACVMFGWAPLHPYLVFITAWILRKCSVDAALIDRSVQYIGVSVAGLMSIFCIIGSICLAAHIWRKRASQTCLQRVSLLFSMGSLFSAVAGGSFFGLLILHIHVPKYFKIVGLMTSNLLLTLHYMADIRIYRRTTPCCEVFSQEGVGFVMALTQLSSALILYHMEVLNKVDVSVHFTTLHLNQRVLTVAHYVGLCAAFMMICLNHIKAKCDRVDYFPSLTLTAAR